MHATARTDLTAHLTALPALAGAAVHWRSAPYNAATPLLVLNCISDLRSNSHGGADGLAEALLQVDAYAPDYAAAEALRDGVLDALNGYRGTLGTTVFHAIFHDASRDDEPEAGDGPRSACDLRVHYSVS